MLISWNGYPSFKHNSIRKQLKTFPKKVEKEIDDRKIIWIRLPYLGDIGNSMKKSCYKKVQKCLKENVCFITCYETQKIAIFCSANDSIPNVIIQYKITENEENLKTSLPGFACISQNMALKTIHCKLKIFMKLTELNVLFFC